MLTSRRLFLRGRRLLLPSLAVLAVVFVISTWFLLHHGSVDTSPAVRRLGASRSFRATTVKGLATPTDSHQQPLAPEIACRDELAHLRGAKYDLTETIRYSRRCVRPVFGQRRLSSSYTAERREVTKLPGPLILPGADGAATINLTRSSCGTSAAATLPACEPLDLRVTPPYPRDATFPHLLFGASSSYTRMLQALDGFAHWLGGSGAQLVVIVPEADKHDLQALEMAYHARSIRLRAMPPQNRSWTIVQNHFAVLESLLDVATPQTKWLGIVDDDTFFPSLYKLDGALQAYSHTKPTWLGALSEDFDSISVWGYMAYGGAGVFLSVPLARQLAPHMGDCLRARTSMATTTVAAKASAGSGGRAGGAATGDGLLRDCIYRHTATKLTVVPGLYQHDLYGDAGGFYESGVLPLSVHHWRSWYKAPLPKMAAVNRLCGDCFLDRWQFGTDTLLANGFSVTQYGKRNNKDNSNDSAKKQKEKNKMAQPRLDDIDLSQMEATWSRAGREFDFSLGPLRHALDATEKKSFRLMDAAFDETDGRLRQVYVYKGDFVADEVDEVVELIWETPAAEQ